MRRHISIRTTWTAWRLLSPVCWVTILLAPSCPVKVSRGQRNFILGVSKSAHLVFGPTWPVSWKHREDGSHLPVDASAYLRNLCAGAGTAAQTIPAQICRH